MCCSDAVRLFRAAFPGASRNVRVNLFAVATFANRPFTFPANPLSVPTFAAPAGGH